MKSVAVGVAWTNNIRHSPVIWRSRPTIRLAFVNAVTGVTLEWCNSDVVLDSL